MGNHLVKGNEGFLGCVPTIIQYLNHIEPSVYRLQNIIIINFISEPYNYVELSKEKVSIKIVTTLSISTTTCMTSKVINLNKILLLALV